MKNKNTYHQCIVLFLVLTLCLSSINIVSAGLTDSANLCKSKVEKVDATETVTLTKQVQVTIDKTVTINDIDKYPIVI